MLIYTATNKVNGKMYVGQTVGSLGHRKGQHVSDTKLHRDGCHFHNAIRKYGIDNFKWKTLHRCNNIDLLNQLEIFYIGYYNTFDNGYNLTEGGCGQSGFKHSVETKNKISVARKGMKFSTEHKRKISVARKGKFLGKNGPRTRAVTINGKYFDTLNEAAKFIGIGPSGTGKRILHKTKWLGYYYN